MSERYDAIVIGGGPAGATAAMVMARLGLRALVIERGRHPRFHIGESFLPRGMALLRELGLERELAAIPQVEKLGAEFGFDHEPGTTLFRFSEGFSFGEKAAFNIERAPFDAMLLRQAERAGAEVIQGATVQRIARLEEGAVAISTDSATFHGRCLVDASGQGTVLGRHLRTRQVLPGMKKIAYFGHFTGVERNPGDAAGFVTGLMCKEGWFWLIPIDAERTSIGLVMDAEAARRIPVPPDQVLAWAIPRSPQMARRCARATFPKEIGRAADFSYTCRPYAGPGYFLAGDAAIFIDPIFSTGVCLGMMGAARAAEAIAEILRGGGDPARLQRRYIQFVESASSIFFRLVRAYYDHSFRELFLQGEDPLQVRRAVLSLLAGHVFPRPAFKLRWRLGLLELFVRLQRHVALAPHRQVGSLFDPSREAPGPSA